MTIATPASTLDRGSQDHDQDRNHGQPGTTTSTDLSAAAPVSDEAGRPSRWGRRVPLISLLALLVVTGVLYLWDLGASGYGNSFYSAAAQAGSQSWKAFFYGSLDAGNSITVDKPPASLWLMALSVRIFGLNAWSILVPQALMGVASVGVLYATVRRSSGHWAGILAGAVLAITPVAALMFRFNNPDALLVLCLTLAVLFTTIATERASGRWLALAGVLIGLGFLTKMLQAFLVLPALGLVYLIAAPTSVRKRIVHLLLAAVSMVVALGWWVAIVELVPASWRPYVGGSENNSVLELIFGYNGLGRIFGQGGGGGAAAAGGAGGGGTMWGQTGITRLFTSVSGGMIAWLVPAALIMAAVAFVIIGRAPRTDRRRAALIIMSTWMVVTALVFSFMAGIYHDYYTVALAPAIAGTVAVAATVLHAARRTWLGRVGLAAATAVTSVTAVLLLGEATAPYTTLRWPVAVLGALATVGWLVAARRARPLVGAVTAAALVAGLTGPLAYTLNTVATPHTGSIVTAGPVAGRGMGGGGFGGPTGTRPDGRTGTGTGTGNQPPAQGTQPGSGTGTGAPTGRGGPGGGTTVTAELKTLLSTDASSYTWVAATNGSQSAASLQLSTGYPVMAIGGFNGGDPSPTLEQFQQLVAAGKIHYYIGGEQGGQGGQGGPGGGDRASSAISTWVAAHYTATTVGQTTVYDLTQPIS